MEEKTIKSISPVPFGLIMGVITGVRGLIFTVIFALFYFPLLSSLIPPPETVSVVNVSVLPSVFGIIALVAIPVMAFVGGFIQGFLIAVIYNFIAPRIGGIRIVFKETL